MLNSAFYERTVIHIAMLLKISERFQITILYNMCPAGIYKLAKFEVVMWTKVLRFRTDAFSKLERFHYIHICICM